MTQILYAEVNIFAAAILSILFLSIHKDSSRRLYRQRLFLLLLLFTITSLCADTISLLVDGAQGQGMRTLNVISAEVYYLLCPIPCLLWTLYASYQIHNDERRIKKLLLPLLIPVLINSVLAVMSLFNDIFFTIGSDNIRQRGPALSVAYIICYFYLVFAFVLIVRAKNKLDRRVYYSLLVFPVLPFIGGIVKFLGYGVTVIWPSVALSLLMIFLNIQNNQIFTDYLTGLFNRKQLAVYLDERIRRSSSKRPIAGIMLDIDNLKAINDTYGHQEGDRAIVYTAQILKKSVNQDAFVARFAGDEFIMICKAGEEQLQKTVQSILDNVDDFNQKNLTPYKLEFSMGYDVLDFNARMNALEFTNHIDELMYKAKRGKKTKENAK